MRGGRLELTALGEQAPQGLAGDQLIEPSRAAIEDVQDELCGLGPSAVPQQPAGDLAAQAVSEPPVDAELAAGLDAFAREGDRLLHQSSVIECVASIDVAAAHLLDRSDTPRDRSCLRGGTDRASNSPTAPRFGQFVFRTCASTARRPDCPGHLEGLLAPSRRRLAAIASQQQSASAASTNARSADGCCGISTAARSYSASAAVSP